jgi:hypothetical protein
MISYKEIKTWYKQKENKDKVVMATCFVLVFLVGFGTGSYVRETRPVSVKSPYNNTTSQAKLPVSKPVVTQTGTQSAVAGATVATTTSSQGCAVKGNPSSKIYHVAGGAFYNTLKSPQCFATEAEAVAAGFVKSGR